MVAAAPGSNTFRKTGIITLAAVYFLILVGGIVRSTGSGMGCPDWPRCFGKWIPPTDQAELPDNYKEIYSGKRKTKNYKVASYLRMLNLNSLAAKIEGDDSIYQELDFNPVKTWIEYLNRLTGVAVGILIFILAIISLRFFKIDSSIPFLSIVTLILVGFEGWMGSLVVSTNLLPFIITAHMAVALLIVALIVYLICRFKETVINDTNFRSSLLSPVLTMNIILIFIQILIGTQVREEIDLISSENMFQNRNTWIEQLGNSFIIHRSFSLIILAANLSLFFLMKKSDKLFMYFKTTLYCIFALLIVEIAIGIVMAYFSIPAFVQPLHLFFGSLLFGLYLYLAFRIKSSHLIKSSVTLQ